MVAHGTESSIRVDALLREKGRVSAEVRLAQGGALAVTLCLQALCAAIAGGLIMDFGVILKTYLAEITVFDGLFLLAARRWKLRLDLRIAFTMPLILFAGAVIIGTYKSTRR